MKKKIRFLSFPMVFILVLYTAPLVSKDIDGINKNAQNTKFVVEGYAFLTHGLLLCLDNGRGSNRSSSSSLHIPFSIENSFSTNSMSQRNSKSFVIDKRERIKNMLTNLFYGSNCTSIDLLI